MTNKKETRRVKFSRRSFERDVFFSSSSSLDIELLEIIQSVVVPYCQIHIDENKTERIISLMSIKREEVVN